MRPAPAIAERLSAEEYFATSAEGAGELWDGIPVMAAAPNTIHQRIAREIAYFLTHHLRGKRGIGECFPSPFDVLLNASTVFQPDVCFITAEQRASLSGKRFTGAPAWVCEVMSPSDSLLPVTRKLHRYAAAGVQEIWLVDPTAAEMGLYVPKAGQLGEPQIIIPGQSICSAIIDGFCMDVGQLFETAFEGIAPSSVYPRDEA